jgi:hypothetical protein
MWRLPFTRRPADDGLDAELTSLFVEGRERLREEPAGMASGQLRVARLLRQAVVDQERRRGLGVWRRLGWAAGGGSGMWGGMMGIAAAHKLAAVALGASVLLGGTVAVEASGVGPAVLDSVGVHQASSEHSVLHTGTPTTTATVGAAGSTASPEANPTGTGLPGNLVTQLHADGRFTVRGQLLAGTTAVAAVVQTADGPLTFDYDPSVVHATGEPTHGNATVTPTPVNLADYIGYGVFITGTCTQDPLPASLADCATAQLQVERVQVLGRAGQVSADPAATASPGIATPSAGGLNSQHGRGPNESATPAAIATATATPTATTPSGLSHRPDH